MKKRFALCIDDGQYSASLIPRKIYEIIPDEKAERDDFIRIVDESGEDYLHRVSHLVLIDLPKEAEQALVAA